MTLGFGAAAWQERQERQATAGLDDPFRPLGRSGTAAQEPWGARYVRRIVIADAGCALLAALTGYAVRFGAPPGRGAHAELWLAASLPAVWVFVMLIARSYERRFLWLGPEEFRRIFFASALLLAIVATLSWGFRLEVARGFVVVALPLNTALTLGQRYAQRKRVHRQRRRGRLVRTTLLVGHRGDVDALHRELERDSFHGYRVVGCCLPDSSTQGRHGVTGLPVLGALDDVAQIVRTHRIDTVAVLPCPELGGAALRGLGWDLETTGAELLLAPAVTEIAGPRVRIRSVCGLPLVHVERPELRGLRRLVKGVVDRVGAAVLILLLLPVLGAVLVTVACSGPGPILFRQQRIGRNGRSFSMLKFRTMRTDAEAMLPELTTRNEGNGVLFKIRDDPRVTMAGQILRRYSLDELPQLFNVLRGDMSLVGPRPPVPSEVARYGRDMWRRFLVKPGLTGLWQISGRSDLSWEDSVRADVRYVENWSLTLDLMILWKTIGAVLRGSGAY